MATTLLSIGSVTVITQNVVYALPAQPSTVTTSIACETSVDGTTWAAFTSGGVTTAKFIRCTTGAPIVAVNKAAVGTGAGGGTVGPVVTLTGPPVPAIILVDPSQPANARRFMISITSPGLLFITPVDDANNPQQQALIVDRNGAISCLSISVSNTIGANSANAVLQVNGPAKFLEKTVAIHGNPGTFGSIANISDSTVNTFGATIAGGGSFHVLGRWNGSNWICIGV